MRLGADLPRFMETGLTGASRILAVCSENYVQKANAGKGGVGYEKMILSAQLMKDVASDRIIPVLRNNTTTDALPTFLSSRLYVDFRDNDTYEARYAELLRDVHGVPVAPRPPLGPNPFTTIEPNIDPRLSFTSERYVSPALSGTVEFDDSNNNGRYAVGAGDMLFETAWTGDHPSQVIAYSDPPSIRTIALADGVADIKDIQDASIYDTSSRVRRPSLGEIVVWKNTNGYYLATKIEKLRVRQPGVSAQGITFSYQIAPNKGSDFSSLR